MSSAWLGRKKEDYGEAEQMSAQDCWLPARGHGHSPAKRMHVAISLWALPHCPGHSLGAVGSAHNSEWSGRHS